MEEEQTTQWAK